ncbi:MAG: alpha/beta hydrolase [Firmicutes bacterium]|nr:alpha/beta hydrolase [Bacillota bacterium]
MPFHVVNGIRLHYQCHGPEDRPWLILNNGIFMNTGSWGLQVPDLARHYHVLAYDMRGQGQSDHPESDYSMALHGEDLVGLMDALGIERAHMVGTSYGGELNLVMGIHHPERCLSLTLIASVSHSEGLCTAMVDRWRVASELGDGPAFFRLIYADVYSEAFLASHPELLPMVEQRYAELDLCAARRLIRSFEAFDVRADLGRIQLPTCIVAAELDLLKPRRYDEIMHQAIPNSELHMIPGAGHVVVIEKPAEVNTIILGFLAKHAGAA